MTKKEYEKMKGQQLGMAISTARSKLFKSIIFDLAKNSGKVICFRCNNEITEEADFTVDHKKEWLHEQDAASLYFDLDNIGFSHSTCNSAAARCSSVVKSGVGFKGVYAPSDRKRKKKYRAALKVGNKTINIGYFATPEEAAIAYDTAAIETYGDRAVTNKMLGLIDYGSEATVGCVAPVCKTGP